MKLITYVALLGMWTVAAKIINVPDWFIGGVIVAFGMLLSFYLLTKWMDGKQ